MVDAIFEHPRLVAIYDALDPEPGLPASPLDVDPAPVGFRRAVD